MATLPTTFFTKQPLLENITSDELISVLKGLCMNLPFTLILTKQEFFIANNKKFGQKDIDELRKDQPDSIILKDIIIPELWDNQDTINSAYFIALVQEDEIHYSVINHVRGSGDWAFRKILFVCCSILSKHLTKINKPILTKLWQEYNPSIRVPSYITQEYLPSIGTIHSLPNASGVYYPQTISVVISLEKPGNTKGRFFSTLVHEYQHFISSIRSLIISGKTVLPDKGYEDTSSDYDPSTNISSTSTAGRDLVVPWNKRLEEMQSVMVEKLHSNKAIGIFAQYLIDYTSERAIADLLAGRTQYESMVVRVMSNNSNLRELLLSFFDQAKTFNWLTSSASNFFKDLGIGIGSFLKDEDVDPVREKQAYELFRRIITTWSNTNKVFVIDTLRRLVREAAVAKAASKAKAKMESNMKTWSYDD